LEYAAYKSIGNPKSKRGKGTEKRIGYPAPPGMMWKAARLKNE